MELIKLFEKINLNFDPSFRMYWSLLNPTSYNLDDANIIHVYSEDEMYKKANNGDIILIVYSNKCGLYNYYNGGLTLDLSNALNFDFSETQKFLEAFIIKDAVSKVYIMNKRQKDREGMIVRHSIKARLNNPADYDKSGYKLTPDKYKNLYAFLAVKNKNQSKKLLELIKRYNKALEKLNKAFFDYQKYFLSDPNFRRSQNFPKYIYDDFNDTWKKIFEANQKIDKIMGEKIDQDRIDELSKSIKETLPSIQSDIEYLEKRVDTYIESSILKNLNSNKTEDEVIEESLFNKSLFSRISEAVKESVTLLAKKNNVYLYKGKFTRNYLKNQLGLYTLPKSFANLNYLLLYRDLEDRWNHGYYMFNLDGNVEKNYGRVFNSDKEATYEVLYDVFKDDIYKLGFLEPNLIINDNTTKEQKLEFFKNVINDNFGSDGTISSYVFNNTMKDIFGEDYKFNKEEVELLLNEKNRTIINSWIIKNSQKEVVNELLDNKNIVNAITYYNEFNKNNRNEYDDIIDIDTDKLIKLVSEGKLKISINEIRNLEDQYNIKFPTKFIINAINNSDLKVSFYDIQKILKNHDELPSSFKKSVYKQVNSQNQRTLRKNIPNIKMNGTELFKSFLETKETEFLDRLVKYNGNIPEDIKKSIKLILKSYDEEHNTDYYSKFINK